jgi:bacillithiol biosynthesis cysteine-adding enzyme BshC
MPRTFYSSYLAGAMSAQPLYPVGFGAAAERIGRARTAASRAVTPQLLDRLRAQNAALPPSPARDRNLEALADHGAAVITGQQVGLFLGPLYTLHKAATAVAVARMLSAESGVRCVPVFWLQTEDHDFAEIASCRVARGDGSLVRLELGSDAGLAARCAIAHRSLGDDVHTALARVGEALEGAPFAADVGDLLARHYRAGTSWPRAFAGLIAELFADAGLIVFDPREEAVARLAAPVIRRSLQSCSEIDAALARRREELERAGFAEQVTTRPGSPLAFFHVGNSHGPRHRLRSAGDGFIVENGGESLTLAELLATCEADPLRFSTSALLRPLVQDTLLPTAAYVGGPAEVSYFAQLEPLYPLFDLPPPLLVPRARFRLVPHDVRRLLDKLGLSAADVEQPREPLLAQIAGAQQHDGAPGRTWLSELERRLDAMLPTAPALDSKLPRAVERTRATVTRAIDRLARRYTRAQLARDDLAHVRLDRLRAWLFPDDEPQERVHTFVRFAAQVGLGALIDKITNAVDPLHPEPKDIDL